MTILVTGDRNWPSTSAIAKWLEYYKPELVMQGGARGADKCAKEACEALGIPCETYPADWRTFGRAAGPIRNRKMLNKEPDLVLAFHNDLSKSKGTKDCVNEAQRRGIRVMHVRDILKKGEHHET